MTLDSGQVFHWEKIDNGFFGTIGDRPVYAEQRGDSLRVTKGCADLICNYFALDHPLAKICASFPNDALMQAARTYCRGLRIIRQPTLGMSRHVHLFVDETGRAYSANFATRYGERFGEQRKIGKQGSCTTFPSAERIAGSSEKELRECALGYRAKNLLATARAC